MRILLSNDDGCTAPGLIALRDVIGAHHQVTVVAPDRNRSAASNSLTTLTPLRVHRHADGVYCVDGTPSDSVHLALNGLLEEAPEMVVSGINAGVNLGDDTLYSGTVAAAMEGRWLGTPSIAISSVTMAEEPRHFVTAARVALRLVEQLRKHPLPKDTILNVNVPDLAEEQLQGFEVTRLGHRHRTDSAVRTTDPRGRAIWWLGPVGAENDGGPGTDFNALSNGRVSITPLLIDLTRHAALDSLRQWVNAL